MRIHDFGKDFFFGTATASYQVEGGLDQGRRASCIWDDFSKIPGRVYMNENGSVACNHWNLWKEDILLMKKLGFSSYRFSVAWPRIFPEYGSEPNKEALDHYRDICRFLHENGMTAAVTLYHWDLPSYLQEKGGWTWRGTAYEYERYASALFSYIGDEADSWITLNEPYCSSYLGYYYGVHAPGHRDLDETLCTIHHLNLAHGLAVKAHRRMGLKSTIGITWNLVYGKPVDGSPMNIHAAELQRAVMSEVFTKPVFEGRYPALVQDELGFRFPVEDGDMETISQKIDFVGLNYYSQRPVMWTDENPFHFTSVPFWHEMTDMGWPITPYEFRNLLTWLHSVSGDLPIYITENGYAGKDSVSEDGRIHDKDRIRFFMDNLEGLELAIREGIPVKGYYVWSFLDNYEWAEGYSKRFGIVWTDYDTLRRIPKDSAYFFRDVNAGHTYW